MKASLVQIGRVYVVKVSGTRVPVRIVREHDNGGWVGVNIATGREVRIKTVARLRCRLPDNTTKANWSIARPWDAKFVTRR